MRVALTDFGGPPDRRNTDSQARVSSSASLRASSRALREIEPISHLARNDGRLLRSREGQGQCQILSV